MVPWIVIHVARTIEGCHVESDGQTNYEGWNGKQFGREAAEFGECVHFKHSTAAK